MNNTTSTTTNTRAPNTPAGPAAAPNKAPQKRRRTAREAIHITDENDEAIVLVPIANSPRSARIRVEDYRRITEDLGYSKCWQYNNKGRANSYVRLGLMAHQRGAGDWGLPVLPTHIPVARLVLNAAPGMVVRYRDGDRLNLVADNLYVQSAEDVEYPGKDDATD